MASTSSDIAIILSTLTQVLQSELFIAAFVFAIGLFFFAIFAISVVASVYVLSYAWAGYENRFAKGDDDEMGFDETKILQMLEAFIGSLGSTLAALGALLASAATSIGSAILNNVVLIFVFLFTFILVVMWDTWHAELIQSAGETYTCFIAPVVRTLGLPLWNTLMLVISAPLAILDAVREVWISITTETIIETLVCGAAEAINVIEGIVFTIVGQPGAAGRPPVNGIVLALIEWLQGVRGSPLEVAADFFSAGTLLGRTIASLAEFADCVCLPISEIVIRPLFVPFNSTYFAQFFNATLNVLPIPIIPILSPVLLTQGILRPIVGTVQNLANETGDQGFNAAFVRPSFNSTFDTLEASVINGGEFLDLYGQALFNITVNIVRESISTCPSHPPWTASGSCSDEPGVANGTCLAGFCATQFISVRGCCKANLPGNQQCVSAVLGADICTRDFNGAFFEGEQCAQVSTCPQIFGCCGTGLTFNGTTTIAQQCQDDVLIQNCVGSGFAFTPRNQCASVPRLRCTTQVPLATTSTFIGTCSLAQSCVGNGTPCSCDRCTCRYSANRTPAVANSTITRALNECRNGTVPGDDDPLDQCRVPVPIDVIPPVPALVTGTLYLTVDLVIQTGKYGFNILFNIDTVFTTLDGYLFWRINDTIGPAARKGFAAIAEVFFWFADLIREVGNILANLENGSARPSTSKAVRAMQSLSIAQRAQLDQTFATTGELIRFAFDLIATVIDVIGDFLRSVGDAIVSTAEFVIEQFFGAIYFAVRTGIENGFPDIFAYAKIAFGGDAPTGIPYTCFVPSGVNTTAQLFTARVNNAAAVTCTEETELLEFCRFVFQRSTADGLSSTNPTSEVPSFITLLSFQPNIPQLVQECIFTVQNCGARVLPIAFPPGFEKSINQFEVLLQQYVNIARALDPLVSIWCDDCSDLGAFISGFVEPLVPILMVPIDLFVHIEEMFTSGYIACLDIDGAALAINDFVTNFTNLFRAINQGVTGQTCLVGVGQRDSLILCAIAQGVDSVINVVIQLVLIVWHIIQGLVRVIQGVYSPEAILNAFSFNTVEAPVQDASFAFFAVFLQIIPRSIVCIGEVNANVGCCRVFNVLTPTPAGASLCLPRQSGESCAAQIATSFPYISPPVFQILTDQTCAQAQISFGFTCASSILDPRDDQVDVLQYGCCKNVPARFRPGEPFLANSCIDEAGLFTDDCPPEVPTNQFFINQNCSTAVFPDGSPSARCPIVDGPVQTVVATAFGQIVGDLILAIPKVVAEVIIRFAELFINPDIEDAFRALLEAFFEPIFEILSDVFRQLGNIAGCAGSASFQTAFNSIADFIERELCLVVQLVSDLVLFVVFLVFGLIEAVTTFSFDLLALAGEFFLRVILSFAFAVFSPEVVCNIQGFLCDVESFLEFDSQTDFAVHECRVFFCCAFTPPREPLDTNTPASQCDIPGEISSCSDVTCDTCSGTSSPSTNAFGNPFLQNSGRKRSRFTTDDLKRIPIEKSASTDPTAAFCGAYLATFGMENARSANCTDAMALKCIVVADQPEEPYPLFGMLQKEYARARVTYDHTSKIVLAHWRDIHKEARAPLTKGGKKTRGRSIADLVKDVHGVEFVKYSKRSVAVRVKHRAAAKSLWKTHNGEVVRSAFVGFTRAVLNVKDAIDKKEHHTLGEWIAAHFRKDVPVHLSKRSIPNLPMHHHFTIKSNKLTGAHKRAAAFAVGFDAFARQWNHISAALSRRFIGNVRRLLPTPERKAERQKLIDEGMLSAETRLRNSGLIPQRQARFGAQAFDERLTNITLAAIGIFACNESTQVFCTGCLIVDNLIFAGEEAYDGLRTFYPDEQTGFLSYVKIHTEGFENTLVDPIGTDTFTTVPKRTPWLFERLLTVQWFWQWDYSEFISIVTQNGTSPTDFDEFVNQTQIQQAERALAVGRVDYDNQVFDLFGRFILGPINFAERVVGALNGAFSIDVFAAVFTRYIKCDYIGALQCQSDLGIGLFDALANVILVSSVAILLVNQILPGMGILIFIVTAALSYIITLWIAYGASPLCTLPSFVGGIIGIPTCLPVDLQTIVAELFPQCFPIPISLIDPSALAEASTTLCAVCGTQPLLQNCADAAGFLNGFDNFFYITGILLPPDFNQFIADTVASVAPDIAVVAALYTPEYIAELGDVGAVCNRILITNLITAAAITAIIGTLLLFIVGGLAFFIIASFWLYWAMLLAANAMIMQMDKGFVQGTTVEKLKLKGD